MDRKRRIADERGFTLIDMLFVISIIGVLSVMALPGIMRARGAAQATSALGSMRAINSGQLSYAITCGLGFYSPDLPTLGVRPPGASTAFLPDGLTHAASVFRHGYSFTVLGTPLAAVLHAQAADAREAGRRVLLETGARREVLMMVPVVFLILPVTVLFAFWPGLVGLRLVTP